MNIKKINDTKWLSKVNDSKIENDVVLWNFKHVHEYIIIVKIANVVKAKNKKEKWNIIHNSPKMIIEHTLITLKDITLEYITPYYSNLLSYQPFDLKKSNNITM